MGNEVDYKQDLYKPYTIIYIIYVNYCKTIIIKILVPVLGYFFYVCILSFVSYSVLNNKNRIHERFI